jgi:hypothetical protein
VSEPTSWLSIKPGWQVVAADGDEVGEVSLVTGDENQDIFDGLAVSPSALGKPRYVAAEQVAEITDGVVHLSLDRAEAESLPEYLEPATSAIIEPDDKGGFGNSVRATAREVEGGLVTPVEHHEHPPGFLRRLRLYFRRKTG